MFLNLNLSKDLIFAEILLSVLTLIPIKCFGVSIRIFWLINCIIHHAEFSFISKRFPIDPNTYNKRQKYELNSCTDKNTGPETSDTKISDKC